MEAERERNRRIALVVNMLAATYNREVSPALLQAWKAALRDVPIEQVEVAAEKAMRTSKFFPAPAEIRQLAGAAEPTVESRALAAWTEFERAVTRHGPYKSVDFADRLINATVRHLGGWEHCCDLRPSEFDKWLRKDFLKTYQAFAGHHPGDEACAPLVGFHERRNGVRKQPVLIGYTDRRRLASPETHEKTPRMPRKALAGPKQPAEPQRILDGFDGPQGASEATTTE